jgi:formylglycine-generating enzyme required for sulfatase activity
VTTAKEGRASEPIKDCDGCPEMVAVPPGTFQMGSPESDKNAAERERPERVEIPRDDC